MAKRGPLKPRIPPLTETSKVARWVMREERKASLRQEPALAFANHVSRHGPEYYAAALNSRRADRTQDCLRPPAWLVEDVNSCLTLVLLLDTTLVHLRRNGARPPSFTGRSWVDHLAWGVDSQVACLRLLLVGQLPGAAMLARFQLEHWTRTVGKPAHLHRRSRESVADYLDRLWQSRAVWCEPTSHRPSLRGFGWTMDLSSTYDAAVANNQGVFTTENDRVPGRGGSGGSALGFVVVDYAARSSGAVAAGSACRWSMAAGWSGARAAMDSSDR